MKKYQNDPHPIAVRECACGCGNPFQPTRINQKYLNKKHCDYARYQRKKKGDSGEAILTKVSEPDTMKMDLFRIEHIRR